MVRRFLRGLMDLGRRRTPLQALGFYLAYLVLFMLAGFLAGALAAMILHPADPVMAGEFAGLALAVALPVLINFAILKAKNRLDCVPFLLLIPLSGVVGYFFGGLGGLIPAAFLTTRKSKEELENIQDGENEVINDIEK